MDSDEYPKTLEHLVRALYLIRIKDFGIESNLKDDLGSLSFVGFVKDLNKTLLLLEDVYSPCFSEYYSILRNINDSKKLMQVVIDASIHVASNKTIEYSILAICAFVRVMMTMSFTETKCYKRSLLINYCIVLSFDKLFSVPDSFTGTFKKVRRMCNLLSEKKNLDGILPLVFSLEGSKNNKDKLFQRKNKMEQMSVVDMEKYLSKKVDFVYSENYLLDHIVSDEVKGDSASTKSGCEKDSASKGSDETVFRKPKTPVKKHSDKSKWKSPSKSPGKDDSIDKPKLDGLALRMLDQVQKQLAKEFEEKAKLEGGINSNSKSTLSNQKEKGQTSLDQVPGSENYNVRKEIVNLTTRDSQLNQNVDIETTATDAGNLDKFHNVSREPSANEPQPAQNLENTDRKTSKLKKPDRETRKRKSSEPLKKHTTRLASSSLPSSPKKSLISPSDSTPSNVVSVIRYTSSTTRSTEDYSATLDATSPDRLPTNRCLEGSDGANPKTSLTKKHLSTDGSESKTSPKQPHVQTCKPKSDDELKDNSELQSFMPGDAESIQDIQSVPSSYAQDSASDSTIGTRVTSFAGTTFEGNDWQETDATHTLRQQVRMMAIDSAKIVRGENTSTFPPQTAEESEDCSNKDLTVPGISVAPPSLDSVANQPHSDGQMEIENSDSQDGLPVVKDSEPGTSGSEVESLTSKENPVLTELLSRPPLFDHPYRQGIPFGPPSFQTNTISKSDLMPRDLPVKLTPDEPSVPVGNDSSVLTPDTKDKARISKSPILGKLLSMPPKYASTDPEHLTPSTNESGSMESGSSSVASDTAKGRTDSENLANPSINAAESETLPNSLTPSHPDNLPVEITESNPPVNTESGTSKHFQLKSDKSAPGSHGTQESVKEPEIQASEEQISPPGSSCSTAERSETDLLHKKLNTSSGDESNLDQSRVHFKKRWSNEADQQSETVEGQTTVDASYRESDSVCEHCSERCIIFVRNLRNQYKK